MAFFIQDMRGGGAERSVARLVNGVAASGIKTDLVLMQGKGPFLAEIAPDVEIVDLKVARTATAWPALRRYIDQARPQVLYSAMTHTNVLAVAAARTARHRTRLVLVEHNQFSANKARKSGLVRLSYALVPYLYRFADEVAGVSAGVRDTIADAARLPRDRVRILYNPIVTPALPAMAAEPVDHPWAGGDAPLLVAVGRLTPQKNFPMLIDAMAQVKEHSPARLIILGEGEEHADLARRIAAANLGDRIDLAGFRRNPFPLMRACDAYVMSSDWEGLPTVLVEAMAVGAPIVSTDCVSGPSEILEEGRLGRLVPPGDAAAMAQAILATLTDTGDRAARMRRAQEFSVERAVAGYLEAGGLSAAPLARAEA